MESDNIQGKSSGYVFQALQKKIQASEEQFSLEKMKFLYARLDGHCHV